MEQVALEQALVALTEKIDTLSEQVQFLTAQVQASQARQREWDEWKQDLTPAINDVYQLTVEQLAEVEGCARLEDILHLFKRLLRNTCNLQRLLDQLEGLNDFIDDASPLAQEVFLHLVETLDHMEHQGYFAFGQETLRLVDTIVTSFTPEDVRLLADNIVLILNTVKEMTQPEIMRLMHNLTSAYRQVEAQPETLPTSTLALLKQMRDPEVRQGLALTMQMLKAVAQNQTIRT